MYCVMSRLGRGQTTQPATDELVRNSGFSQHGDHAKCAFLAPSGISRINSTHGFLPHNWTPTHYTTHIQIFPADCLRHLKIITLFRRLSLRIRRLSRRKVLQDTLQSFQHIAKLSSCVTARRDTRRTLFPLNFKSERAFLKYLLRRDWRRTEKIFSKKFSCISKNVCERYLIPFATHAFVFQRQECASLLPSLLVFPMISTDFTPTP